MWLPLSVRSAPICWCPRQLFGVQHQVKTFIKFTNYLGFYKIKHLMYLIIEKGLNENKSYASSRILTIDCFLQNFHLQIKLIAIQHNFVQRDKKIICVFPPLLAYPKECIPLI